MAITRRSFVGANAAAAAAMAASGRSVKIGIVGGRFGASFQWHLHPQCEVAAVCDIRPERVQTLQEVYRSETGYDDFHKMLAHPGLEAVGVFTPAPLHAWMAIEAMEAGKHVVSAVPAALTLGDLERLIETVKRTGMRYMMAETTYYRPQIITCRQWADEGLFGDIFYSESEYHHNISRLMWDERGLPTWRHGLSADVVHHPPNQRHHPRIGRAPHRSPSDRLGRRPSGPANQPLHQSFLEYDGLLQNRARPQLSDLGLLARPPPASPSARNSSAKNAPTSWDANPNRTPTP